MDGLGRVQGNAHKHVNENVSCPLVVLRHFQPHVSEVLRFLCLWQLSGWTSNLVDIIMGHHFSTVSHSNTHTHTTYSWYNLSSCLSLHACVVFLFRMSWQRIRSWSRLTDSTYLRTSLRKIWPCSTTAMTGTTTPPCGWSRGLELTINHWLTDSLFFALYEKWL